MNTEEILAEREKTHGSYGEHANVTQSLKRIVRKKYRKKMSDTQREAVDMILHKLGRICAGDASHKDHWDDIAGYATLVSREL